MATKKTAAKKAPKKAPKKAAAKPKAMTTDEALQALREWQNREPASRYYVLCSLRPIGFECSVVRIDGWEHVPHTKRGATEAQAITKALAAAKKAGHA